MKNLNQWFSEYAESHQNPTNKTIHFICIPLIYFSIVGLLSCFSIAENSYLSSHFPDTFLHWGTIGVLIVNTFYLRYSFIFFFGMFVFGLLCLFVVHLLANQAILSSLWVYLLIFISAWIGQFKGHQLEGKKPSFFKDIQFLLIGPAWLLSFLYKKIGIID